MDSESTPVAGVEITDELDAEIAGAIELIARGLDRLQQVGDRGDLMALGPERLIDVAQRLEQQRSRWIGLDSFVVEAATEERLEAHTCTRSIAAALAGSLRISRAAAKARVELAGQLMPRNGFSEGTQSAELPTLAAAVRAGQVTPDQASVIGRAMKTQRSNPEISAEQSEVAEQTLVTQASALGPEDLRVVAAKIDDLLLPDGVLPRESLAQARRGLTLGPERRDGTHAINGFLTRVSYARLMSVLSPLAAPRPADDAMGADARTPEQRMHDALEAAASRLLDSAGLPRSGGAPATVHITVDADRLAAAVTGDPRHHSPTRAVGETSFGDRLTFVELAQLAEQATLIPTYLNATGGVIAYGTSRRCASEGQTQALIARDRGCSFPGCDTPPEWCERHHVIPWHRGGPTDLSNLTLVCGYHHAEFDKRGWQVTMRGGVPVWTPPRWIDPAQRPMTNIRIRGSGQASINFYEIPPAAQCRPDSTGPPGAPCPPGPPGELPPAVEPPPPGTELPPEVQEIAESVERLIDLLALHVESDEREEFAYEVGFVLDSFIYPPSRPLQPVA